MPISKSLSKNQELLDLMKQANELHDAVEGVEAVVHAAYQRSIQQAIDCGEKLQAARDLVGHGGWAKFVRKHFNGSERTAQRYMRVYRAVAFGSLKGWRERNYANLRDMEDDITEEQPPPGDPEQKHRDDCEPDAVVDPPPDFELTEPEKEGEEYDFDFDDDAAEDAAPPASSAPEPPAPKPSKKKDSDLLAAAFRVIGKALNSVEGEKKAEWGKLLHAEVDLYMGPFESGPKRARKAAKKPSRKKAAPKTRGPEQKHSTNSDPTQCFWYNMHSTDGIHATHFQDREDEEACGLAFPFGEGEVRCDACGAVSEMPADMAKALAS